MPTSSARIGSSAVVSVSTETSPASRMRATNASSSAIDRTGARSAVDGDVADGSSPAFPSDAASVWNSNRWYAARSLAGSGGDQRSAARSTSTGASCRSVTSGSDFRAASPCSASSLRIRGFFTFARFSSSPSSDPNSASSLAAVFGPIPGTPGTLSVASPTSACRSIIRSGRTPHFLSTSSGPMTSSLSATNSSTRSLTSWHRSLSELMITTGCSADTFAVTVASTSSASKPSFCSAGMPNASSISRTKANCGRRSSGGGGRLALYAGYSSSRKVGVRESIATPRYRGVWSATILCSILVTPNSAPVGSPFDVVRLRTE